MLFDSYQYVLFLPLIFALYYAMPPERRWILLLLASYVFYMAWEPAYAILIFISTVADYSLARAMGRVERRRPRMVLLGASLAINLGLLGTFKYIDFFRSVLQDLLNLSGFSASFPALNLLLPVGISFYTFQTLGYTIDVYRRRIEPERHFGIFALYVSFFPQLVAGPIERSHRLLPQLKKHHSFHYPDGVEGLRLILWGLFKKMVVADRLAEVVDVIYADPERYPGPVLVLATVCFAFQIYCDFSGYSDIAIGSARLLGIHLMTNFRRPYHARSIQDFWQRWHISLSTWFRDYVYLPLGGNRVSPARWFVNILVVFILSGFWHGANWTFVAWGFMHALLYLCVSSTDRLRARCIAPFSRLDGSRIQACWQWGATFVAVNIAWVFFRAESLSDAMYIFSHLHTGWGLLFQEYAFRTISVMVQVPKMSLVAMFALWGLLVVVEAWQRDVHFDQWLCRFPRPLRWACYIGVAFVVLNGGIEREIPFVYFQF
jgi:D-alanyl-lipoteichoic acid acyltransferase DltB (MBOAT superfamily)